MIAVEKKIEDNADAQGSEEDLKPTKERKRKESKSVKPGWVKMNFQEFEDLVVDLAKKGETPSRIGLILRDSHGIPKSRVFETKITKILKAKGVTYKVEKDVFDDQIKDLRKHLEGNKHDYTAKKSLTKKLWVLNRIERQRAKSI